MSDAQIFNASALNECLENNRDYGTQTLMEDYSRERPMVPRGFHLVVYQVKVVDHCLQTYK